MSFILDALKRSESERQQQVPSGFAAVPENLDTPRAPRWLWILGALLAINIAVLLWLTLRPTPPAVPTSVSDTPVELPAPATAPQSAKPDFSERVAVARSKQPQPPDTPVTSAPSHAELSAAGTQVESSSIATNPPATENLALLPSLTELRANGSVTLPDLHVDLHVYNDTRPKRFVFINSAKYRENSQLAEGPVVEEITRDGVVLEYSGTRFTLPRE